MAKFGVDEARGAGSFAAPTPMRVTMEASVRARVARAPKSNP
jgi:hypothetical protein